MRLRWTLFALVLAAAGCKDQKPAPAAGTGTPPALAGPASRRPGRSRGPSAAGRSLTPDGIFVEGRTLSFRKGKDFFAEREIKFDLPEGPLEGTEWTFEGQRFENPTVTVAAMEGQGIPRPNLASPATT